MPLPGMSEEARTEVRRLHRKGLGAVRIARELERLHGEGQIPDLPSERAVGREITKIRRMTEAELRRYDEVVWPESFGTPDLPYASAAAILELTRHLGRPPLLPLARWYWRTLQAFPGADVAALRSVAARLALAEGDPTKVRAIGAAAVAGELGPMELLKIPPGPDQIERAITQIEILRGALPPEMREALREVLGSDRKEAQDEPQG